MDPSQSSPTSSAIPQPDFAWDLPMPTAWIQLELTPDRRMSAIDDAISELFTEKLSFRQRSIIEKHLLHSAKACEEAGAFVTLFTPALDEQSRVTLSNIMVRWLPVTHGNATFDSLVEGFSSYPEFEEHHDDTIVDFVSCRPRPRVVSNDAGTALTFQTFTAVPSQSWYLCISTTAPTDECLRVQKDIVLAMARGFTVTMGVDGDGEGDAATTLTDAPGDTSTAQDQRGGAHDE